MVGKEVGVRQMKRKRMIKLLMSIGFDRNAAVRAADACDGSTSHVRIMNRLCVEFLQIYYKQLENAVIEGDMTGAVAGMVGSVYG
jgi:hypothetical protein|nr:MAG TPA: UBA-like domain protein [Bacteriophage sp.]DAZ82981.1 MAG TPA: UBA-like domain protein [Caudoviricetes sp.]